MPWLYTTYIKKTISTMKTLSLILVLAFSTLSVIADEGTCALNPTDTKDDEVPTVTKKDEISQESEDCLHPHLNTKLDSANDDTLAPYSGFEYAYMRAWATALPLITGTAQGVLIAAPSMTLSAMIYWAFIRHYLKAGEDQSAKIQAIVESGKFTSLNAITAMTLYPLTIHLYRELLLHETHPDPMHAYLSYFPKPVLKYLRQTMLDLQNDPRLEANTWLHSFKPKTIHETMRDRVSVVLTSAIAGMELPHLELEEEQED